MGIRGSLHLILRHVEVVLFVATGELKLTSECWEFVGISRYRGMHRKEHQWQKYRQHQR